MNYEKDLQIDQDSLDKEWVNQPQLFFRYAREQVEAKGRADAAKERLDITRAELDTEIRASYQQAGVKFTEAVVSAAIIVHPTYKATMFEYMRITEEANLLSAAVRAMDQRKSALENLVRLHGQDYFSTPREPEQTDKVRQVTRSDTDMTQGMKQAAAERRRSRTV